MSDRPSHRDLRPAGDIGRSLTHDLGASGPAGDIGLDLGRARGSWARHTDIRRASLKGGAPAQLVRGSPCRSESVGAGAGIRDGSGGSQWSVWSLSLSVFYSPSARRSFGFARASSAPLGRVGLGWLGFAWAPFWTLTFHSLLSPFFFNIASPHLSATPSQSTRLTKSRKIF